MKIVFIIGMAVLLGIVAAWWFTGSEDETNAVPVAAASGSFDASRQMGGNVELLQRQESRPQLSASKRSTAGSDVGSDRASAAPPETVAAAAPATEPVALRNEMETIPGPIPDSEASPPPAIDKTACAAAVKTLEESKSIFDLTPTLAIWYAWSPPYPHAGPNGFEVLKARLLAVPLCSGTSAFDQAHPAKLEFVAISFDAHARILVGDQWISDGSVLSPLSESDQESLTTIVQSRRRGPGPDLSREGFERQLARNPRGLLTPSIRDGQ